MTFTPPEEEPSPLSAERPVRSEFARPSGISYATRRALTIVFLLLVATGAFYFAFGHSHQTGPDEIPTIKAEGTVKEKPAQPGGIDIPHQDVQVYHELDNANASKPQVEHLLPPPETPQPAPVTPPVQKSVSPSVPKMESLLGPPPKVDTTVAQVSPTPPTMSTQSPIAPAVQTTPPSVVAAAAPPPAPVVVQAPQPPPAPAAPAPKAAPAHAAMEPPPVPVVIEATPSVKTGPVAASVPVVDTTKSQPAASASYVGKKNTAVQFASVTDEANAHSMAGDLQSKYAGILSGVHLRVVRADLGAKGIYYRIQSLPVTKEKADDICTSVKKLKAGCIIVHQ